MILPKVISSHHLQLARQIHHWVEAAKRLGDLDSLASQQAWQGMEQYLHLALKKSLAESVNYLNQDGQKLLVQLNQKESQNSTDALQEKLNQFQKKYLRTEMTIDFFADAINSRTTLEMSNVLRACDSMARLSMHKVLKPAGLNTPLVLTYLDKGRGASILKESLRLWDGRTRSPVAAIKVVRHNILRPTALIHEAGHQIAFMLDWNQELATHLKHFIGMHDMDLGNLWGSWASEIAADAFAFAHTGFAAIAGLHDVLSGSNQSAFRFMPLAPHPISYLRLLLGTTFCKLAFGHGPWEQMEKSWINRHSFKGVSSEVQAIVKNSIPLLPKIAKLCLQLKMNAFGGLSLYDRVGTAQVAPKHLLKRAKDIDQALKFSPFHGTKDSLFFLALNGYRITTMPHHSRTFLQQQQLWMQKMGQSSLHLN